MVKKKCELCEGVARMYCESDQANLCWNCDVKGHGAKFLVAKHTRCLLCSVCQYLTSWKASGLRLGPTVSICQFCLARKNHSIAENQVCGLRREADGAESYNEDEGSDDEEEEEEEAESQVVPAQQPPIVSSSFSGDGTTLRDSDLNFSDEEESKNSRSLKRSRNPSRSTATIISVLRSQAERKLNGCDG